jgi:hypothetical protein
MKMFCLLTSLILTLPTWGTCSNSLRESYLERRIFDSSRLLTSWCRYTLNQQLGLWVWANGTPTRYYRDVLPVKYAINNRFELMITHAAIDDRFQTLVTKGELAAVEYSAYDKRAGRKFYLEVAEGMNGSVYAKELIGFLDERCF